MAHHKSSDPNVFILPDLGEGVHEAELIAWKVKPGDRVEEHQTVAEMETDKALVEVPSPRAGVIKELFGSVGDILKVGSVAWTYEGAANGQAGHSAGRGAAASPEPAAARAEAAPAGGEREDEGTVVGTMSGELGAVSKHGDKALATPAVRRLARDLGVDIDRVPGTGIGGRVTEKDVRAAAAGGAGGRTAAPARPAPAARHEPPPARPAPVQPLATTVPHHAIAERPAVLIPAAEGGITKVPFRGVRRTIANRLRESVDQAVHFTVMDEADVSKLDDVRKRTAAASGEKVSYLPFVVSAMCRALKRFPMLNAHMNAEAEEIQRYAFVHMGIAADTEHGLTVPVIPHADALGVLEIGRHIAELARMTRDRSIPRERLSGSTFTISNVGSYAGRFATPIINYPEVGILAVGRARDGVVADRGAIRVAPLLPLSLTCDHRCVDGADAARCLNLIVELLQSPEELLTPARGG
ncbi:MAG: 2-oxo acid dehydrogenase subunit E2 [Phycisphaerales bacterium]|nr:2-oxo acid dehydrogenase subunit E2 [Phycisphaerales bacterium]